MSAQSLLQTTSRRLPTTSHSVHPGFYARKQQILASLIDSTITRTDNNNFNKYSSSKVSSPLIDETICPIIELINKHDDYIVTSSCSGKISIISTSVNNNKCKSSKKFISGKMDSLTTGETENGILHVEARTLDSAKNLVNLAVEIGYRESGLLTTSKRHMVAIRTSMKLETPIAYLNLSTQKIHLLVDLSYLQLLINLSNQNFDEILRKINDLLSTLDNNLFRSIGSGDDGVKKEERRERKRRDVLARQIGLRKSGTLSDGNDGDVSTVDDESQ
ncbi:1863_t:CDS:2, partial [Gigaspora rosea]